MLVKPVLLVVRGILGVLQFLLLELGLVEGCLGQLGRERNVVQRLDNLGELDLCVQSGMSG